MSESITSATTTTTVNGTQRRSRRPRRQPKSSENSTPAPSDSNTTNADQPSNPDRKPRRQQPRKARQSKENKYNKAEEPNGVKTVRSSKPRTDQRAKSDNTKPRTPKPQRDHGPSRTAELTTLLYKLPNIPEIIHTITSSLTKTFKILNKYKLTIPISKSRRVELGKFPDQQYNNLDNNVIRNFNWKINEGDYSVLWICNYIVNGEQTMTKEVRDFKNLELLNKPQNVVAVNVAVAN